MNCHRTRASLSEFLDGRLPLARQRAVERHLAACDSCRTHWRELQAVKRLLAETPAPSAPEGFWEHLYAGLRRPADDRRPAIDSGGVSGWATLLRRRASVRWLWQRAPALLGTAAVLLLLAVAPLQYLESAPPTVALDPLLSRHAGVCARLPLMDRNRMQFIVAEARAETLPE
jgi:anti-sigma factor RsiW